MSRMSTRPIGTMRRVSRASACARVVGLGHLAAEQHRRPPPPRVAARRSAGTASVASSEKGFIFR